MIPAEYLVGLPTSFSVSNAYPNPFNPVTNLDYALPISGNIKIHIYKFIHVYSYICLEIYI